MEKIEVPLQQTTRLICHGPVIIVSVRDPLMENLFVTACNMPIQEDPPLVSVLMRKSHACYPLIAKTSEFGINVPCKRIAEQIMAASVAGAEIEDTWAHTGLTKQKPSVIKPSLVEEAVANLECRVSEELDIGAASLFVARVVAAVADKDSFDTGGWMFGNGLALLHHLGGNRFASSSSLIEMP